VGKLALFDISQPADMILCRCRLKLLQQFHDRDDRVFVLRGGPDGRCYVQLRARINHAGRLELVAAEAVGGSGPDLDRELIAEAWVLVRCGASKQVAA
jgi:hypothetical protein